MAALRAGNAPGCVPAPAGQLLALKANTALTAPLSGRKQARSDNNPHYLPSTGGSPASGLVAIRARNTPSIQRSAQLWTGIRRPCRVRESIDL